MDEPDRKINSVLFICTANRFRSPLAAAIFQKLLENSGQEEKITVSDAGTWAQEGLPVTNEALIFAEKFDVDLSVHRSRTVNATILADYHLILTMEMGQKEAIISEFPETEGKVFMLTEVGGRTAYDVPDPYSPGENAAAIANEIERLLLQKFDQIIALGKDI